MFDDESLKLLDPFLANEEVEHAKLYLEAGRAYAGLPDDQLTSNWLQAWRAFFLQDWAPACDLLWDYTAEFGLRGLYTPERLLSPDEHEKDLASASREIQADTVMQDQFQKELADFRDLLSRWNN